MADIKRCTKCNEIKSISMFRKRRATEDGYNYWYKHCQKVLECKWADRRERARVHVGWMVDGPGRTVDIYLPTRVSSTSQ